MSPFSTLATLFLVPSALLVIWLGRVGGANLSWILFGWLLWLPISLVFSLSPGLSLPQAAILLCLPIAWLAGIYLYTRNQLEPLLKSLPLILLLPLLFWGLLQGPNTFTLKPQGSFNDPNTYAAVLNILSLPLFAHYLASNPVLTSRWLRTGQLALLASVAFVAFLVSSRGAMLALILVLPLLIWLAREQPYFGRKLMLLATVTLVAYLSALSISGGLSVAQRLVATVQEGDPYRIMLMQSAWLMITDHPWLGSGLGTFRLLYPQYRFPTETVTASGWVHNDYLQLWLEAGLPMFFLLLALVIWVLWAGLRTLRQGGKEALLRMGYLAGIGAILIHALVNFLFYFALVSLLVGLYLARVSHTEIAKLETALMEEIPSKNQRAIRLAAGSYAFILGFLLMGQVAVEVLLGKASYIQRVLLQWDATTPHTYPRYQVAYWISVLAPFHPTPPHIMGLELSDGFLIGNLSENGVRDESLVRMAAGRQRAPCYLPYANDALAVILQGSAAIPLDEKLRAQGQAIITSNLECNARHGLSYYYAGILAKNDEDALMWWRAGLAASFFLGDRLLLAAAILSRTTPKYSKELTSLVVQMANAIRTMEANPGVHTDQNYWGDVQRNLHRMTGQRIVELVLPPDSGH